MTLEQQPKSLRTFTVIWLGQTASLIGSNMTSFALTIWAWQQTGEATPLSLIAFFTEVPILIASIFAGVFVDRYNRKFIMIGGDTVAALSTVIVLILFFTNQLAIRHLYVIGAINGLFGYFHGLAFSASQALLVSQQHYVRVGAMGSIRTFGSGVIAPALAGVLYPIVGLIGILLIDIATFAIAVSTLWIVQIPQLQREIENHESKVEGVWQELTFGFRYLWQRPSLMALQLFSLSFIFFDTASAVGEPMILARSNNNTAVLGMVGGAMGLGGLIGGILMMLWGGPKRRIHGLLIGRAFVFGFETMLGIWRSPSLWIGANFCAGLFKPLANSCEEAIWLSKVEPASQGRVFAASSLLTGLVVPLGLLISGPLADRFFEPAMQPGGMLVPIFGNIFGTGTGSGMALQFALFSFIVVLICLGSYAFPVLRDAEDRLPDHQASTN
ncbi:MFS transporter [Chlorogloeopsis sp. ULAP02]|uniref:MFS transporter n=1 Tax=Chlorogloeopsis sp. ULAP02 TaxID=3107926 RepID=UPI00313609A1